MTLGLCMIVKNESETLRRVLDSAAIFADEIVIVDTGSTDDTASVAKEYTDKVYDFEWINDFSAARNFAISKLSTDYFIWLDGDDLVPEQTARAIKRFMRGETGTTDAVMMPYVLGYRADGKPTFSYLRERIIKNDGRFPFKGRVHEAATVFGNVATLDRPIVHAKPAGRVHGRRNLDIYESMLADGDEFTARDVYYHARELMTHGLYAEAIKRFKNFLARGDGFYVNKADACICMSRCYTALGDRDSAMKSALGACAYAPPGGEVCCELGALFFDKQDYGSAAFWYGIAAKLKPDRRSGAFADGSCYGFTPTLWLCVCYDRLGDTKKAFRCHLRAKKLDPAHPSVAINDGYFESLGFTAEKLTSKKSSNKKTST